jgi:hypothetical protein
MEVSTTTIESPAVDAVTTNEQYGWTRLPDGSGAKVLSNGVVRSSRSGLSEFTDSDGTVYTETAEDRRQQDERHRDHVLAFKAKVTNERLESARTRRPQRAGRPTRPGRVTVVRRSKLSKRTSAPTRGSPDDDPDPGEPWALTWVDRAPVVWRLRAAHCRLLELREGVDR